MTGVPKQYDKGKTNATETSMSVSLEGNHTTTSSGARNTKDGTSAGEQGGKRAWGGSSSARSQ